MNYIKLFFKLLQLLNLGFTLVITLIIMLSSNIKIYFYSKEIEPYSLLYIIICFLLIILALYFITLKLNLNIIGLISLIMLSISITVIGIDLIKWFLMTIEGPLTFKGLTIIKTATYEAKHHAFIIAVEQYINILCGDNSLMKNFIDNLPSIKNPNYSEIIKTSYTNIDQLAQNKVEIAIKQFKSLQEIALQQQKESNVGFISVLVRFITNHPYVAVSATSVLGYIGFYYIPIIVTGFFNLKKALYICQQNQNALIVEVKGLVTHVSLLKLSMIGLTDQLTDVWFHIKDLLNTKTVINGNMEELTILNAKIEELTILNDKIERLTTLIRMGRDASIFITKTFVPMLTDQPTPSYITIFNNLAEANPNLLSYLGGPITSSVYIPKAK